MTRVVIIGGGAAGLGCALSLLDTFRARGGSVLPNSLSLVLLEAREQVGGRVSSEEHGGYIIETGAATIAENASGFLELANRLGLQNDLVYSDERARERYLWRAGRLRRLPSRPTEILTSDALSLAGRLRLCAEPLMPPRSTLEAQSDEDESVAAFFRRRIGQNATDELVDAAVNGIYAGDIEQLSMRSALPRLWQMERQHGSLLRALRHSRDAKSQKSMRLCGFRHGLGQLTQALASAVEQAGGEIRLCSPVAALKKQDQGYRVMLADSQIEADRIILALPPKEASRLLLPIDAQLSALYGAIPMAPLLAITLGWPREQVPHPLNGFGFLVPRIERRSDGLRLLGALFMTSALPDFEQAPRGQVVIRAMYGGVHDPDIANLDDGELLEQVRRDLRAALGIWTEPRFIHIQRWADAIEQYVQGHAARVANIEMRLAALPGMSAVGAALHGVSVPDVLSHARESGARIAARLPIRGSQTSPKSD